MSIDIGRRQLLAGTAAAGFGGLALPDSDASAQAGPRSNISVRVERDPEVIDPGFRTGPHDGNIIRVVYQRLVRHRANSGELEMDAAAEVTQTSPTIIDFRLKPGQVFTDGFGEMTAEDVKFSFETLKSKAAAPQFQIIYADITRTTVLDRSRVRFDFASDNWELPLLAGGIPVFSPRWLAGKPFDQMTFEKPVATGPYLIERYDAGRNITFKRNPDYWATDLPVRRGMFNFERIVYRMFKDDVARLEAFKAGNFDFNVEYSAKNWVRGYVSPKLKSGEIVKRELPVANTAGMQGFIFNLRKPIFQDIRVRQALVLAMDYEWMNRQLFYGQYKRISVSYTHLTLPTNREV